MKPIKIVLPIDTVLLETQIETRRGHATCINTKSELQFRLGIQFSRLRHIDPGFKNRVMTTLDKLKQNYYATEHATENNSNNNS